MARATERKRGRPTNAERDAARQAELNAGATDGGTGAADNGDGGGSADDGSIDPASLGSGGTTGGDDNTGGRGRRSDSGKPRGPRRKSAPLDLTDLKQIVIIAHAGIAMATGSNVWELDDKEADNMSAAIQKVARHYDLPDVASETKDWLALLIVAGSIYAPRFASTWARKNTPPPPPSNQEADNNVTPINPVFRGLQ